MIIVKFWVHLSSAEQLRRFKRRDKDPLKSWKLTDEDWRNRRKRKQYVSAVEDMLERTDTEWAPWHLVEGDSKRHARVKVIETTIAEVERGMLARGFKLPKHRAIERS
jgi:polyphosphate kinase 2 (PPK2 family)